MNSSNFGRSSTSNFASSRFNHGPSTFGSSTANGTAFGSSRLAPLPPQLPSHMAGGFGVSTNASPMRYDASSHFPQPQTNFGSSRIHPSAVVAASFVPTVQRDAQYKPDPTVYGYLTSSYNSKYYEQLSGMINPGSK